MYVATTAPGQVLRLNPVTGNQIGGPFVSFTGQNDGHDLQSPRSMQFDALGNLYVADQEGSSIHIYDSAGNSLRSLTSATLKGPADVELDENGAGAVYVVNPGDSNVLRSVAGTDPLSEFVHSQSGGLVDPIAIARGPGNGWYVLDGNPEAPALLLFTIGGQFDHTLVSFTGASPFGSFKPAYLAFGPRRTLFISGVDLNTRTGEILHFGSDGSFIETFVSGLASPTYFTFGTIAVPEPATYVLSGIALRVLPLARKIFGRTRSKRTLVAFTAVQRVTK
ncbi:MAG TPA: hypothetical protein VL175_20590 [Pirellulales bacterium]|nr:hypothetical protein [Pirellulales bacterium]